MESAIVTAKEAEQLALDFLMQDLEIPPDDRDWFTILACRNVDTWYVVEIGVEGLPDKWVLQVWDTGVCDPCSTFVSPIKASSGTSDLAELPASIAGAIASERHD